MEVDLVVDSAGTDGWHVGEPADARMQLAAQRQDLTIDSVARRITDEDFEEFDLILAMDRRNLEDLRSLAPDGCRAEIRLFRDDDPQGPGEVPDPYYGGEAGFRTVVEICRRTARSLVAKL